MCFLKYYFGYLSGYVRITVEGYFVERFMNIYPEYVKVFEDKNIMENEKR